MTNIRLKNRFGLFLLSIIIVLSASISCQKDVSNENGSAGFPPDLATKATSSLVSGFVTDENNKAVLGANVQVGNATTTTDKYGYFEFRNVEVVKEAATVSIKRPGYFNATKTYMAKTGKGAFFRIKLIPKTIAGTINAATGGSVKLANGMQVALPTGGVVNASTGAAYAGMVNVAAYWLDPTATDLNQTMPGDLRGINTDGKAQCLRTFGMTAVELTGSGGELLQVATGKKATLTLPLPSSLQADAPATIPLGYFDEATGFWKEEGKAIKTGNNYVGEVGHFSWWNNELSLGNYVQFDATFVDVNGNPFSGVELAIKYSNANYWLAVGYTDSSGYVNGPIPANSQLTLQVFSSYPCYGQIYSQNITTFNSNITLGNVVLSPIGLATISGSVTDCNNVPVTNGDIIWYRGSSGYFYYERYNLSNLGNFNFNTITCGGGNDFVTIIAEDKLTLQGSSPISFNLVAGSNLIGNLNACGNNIQEFVHWTINGVAENFDYPIDSIFHQSSNWNGSNTPEVYSHSHHISSYQYNYFGYQPANIALNSSQPLIYCWFDNITATPTTPISVNITEYGAIGQYMSGNFSGTMTGQPPTNTPYNVSCSFRVKRQW